jgi:hypothetical protein
LRLEAGLHRPPLAGPVPEVRTRPEPEQERREAEVGRNERVRSREKREGAEHGADDPEPDREPEDDPGGLSLEVLRVLFHDPGRLCHCPFLHRREGPPALTSP